MRGGREIDGVGGHEQDGQERGGHAPQYYPHVHAAEEHDQRDHRQSGDVEQDQHHEPAAQLAEQDLPVAQLGGEEQLQGMLLALAGDDAGQEQRHQHKHREVLHDADAVEQRFGHARQVAHRFHLPAMVLPDDEQGEEQRQAIEGPVRVVALRRAISTISLAKIGPSRRMRRRFMRWILFDSGSMRHVPTWRNASLRLWPPLAAWRSLAGSGNFSPANAKPQAAAKIRSAFRASAAHVPWAPSTATVSWRRPRPAPGRSASRRPGWPRNTWAGSSPPGRASGSC